MAIKLHVITLLVISFVTSGSYGQSSNMAEELFFPGTQACINAQLSVGSQQFDAASHAPLTDDINHVAIVKHQYLKEGVYMLIFFDKSSPNAPSPACEINIQDSEVVRVWYFQGGSELQEISYYETNEEIDTSAITVEQMNGYNAMGNANEFPLDRYFDSEVNSN